MLFEESYSLVKEGVVLLGTIMVQLDKQIEENA
jgi:hypothetical protein